MAIKILPKNKVRDDVQMQRIIREVRFLRALNHPHIIKVYDVYESESTVFIVMEQATGGELFDYIIQHQRLTTEKARHFMRQIVSALDYCHQVRARPIGRPAPPHPMRAFPEPAPRALAQCGADSARAPSAVGA